MDMRPNLSAIDIAARERISVDTVTRALLRAGLLKGHKIGRRGDWRVTQEDYERWVANDCPVPSQKKVEHAN